MNIKKRLLVLAVLAGTMQYVSAADMTGKITLKGTPPPEKEIPLDASCGKLHKEPVKTRLYVVGSGGELADVFVYIKDGLSAKPAPPSDPVVLDQIGCEYVPYVLGLQAKQTLMVKNSDPVIHNIHPTPTVPGNKESNKAQMAGSKPFDYVFENPEVFLRLKCDVHPWMFAYVGLLDHPYYGVTGKDGTFTIKNVPPGKYVVEAVHRKTHPNGKGITQEVTVGPSGAKADYTIELK